MALAVAKKVIFLAKYFNSANIFSKKSVMKLSKCFNINKHLINLKLGKELLYGAIYSLKPVKLKILKTYIKINLANSFIWLSKSFIGAFIFFIQKFNSSFCLYVNYRGLNNFNIKTWYILFLIVKLFDYLRQTKQFI